MKYLKAAMVGVVTGVLAVVIWLAGTLVLPMAGAMAMASSGSGGIASVSAGSGTAMLVWLIGFIVGFAWTIRRSRPLRSAVRP